MKRHDSYYCAFSVHCLRHRVLVITASVNAITHHRHFDLIYISGQGMYFIHIQIILVSVMRSSIHLDRHDANHFQVRKGSKGINWLAVIL